MIFPIFDMSVEDNTAHCLSKSVFFLKIVNSGLYGIKCSKRSVFFTYLHFTPKQLQGSSQFLHECRGQYGPLFD